MSKRSKEDYRDACLSVIEIFERAERNAAARMHLANWRQVVLDTYNNRNEATMESLFRELMALAEALDEASRRELNVLLRDSIGWDADLEWKDLNERARKILERGAIDREDDYLLLRSWYDHSDAVRDSHYGRRAAELIDAWEG